MYKGIQNIFLFVSSVADHVTDADSYITETNIGGGRSQENVQEDQQSDLGQYSTPPRFEFHICALTNV